MPVERKGLLSACSVMNARSGRSGHKMKTVLRVMLAGGLFAGGFGAEILAQDGRVVIGIGAEGSEAGKVRLVAAGIEPTTEMLGRSGALREARGSTFNTSGFAPSAETIDDARALEQYIELRFKVDAGAAAIISAVEPSAPMPITTRPS